MGPGHTLMGSPEAPGDADDDTAAADAYAKDLGPRFKPSSTPSCIIPPSATCS